MNSCTYEFMNKFRIYICIYELIYMNSYAHEFIITFK